MRRHMPSRQHKGNPGLHHQEPDSRCLPPACSSQTPLRSPHSSARKTYAVSVTDSRPPTSPLVLWKRTGAFFRVFLCHVLPVEDAGEGPRGRVPMSPRLLLGYKRHWWGSPQVPPGTSLEASASLGRSAMECLWCELEGRFP